MSKITVSERAVRELVREMFSGDWERAQNVAPVNVSNVVDPSAALTDPGNPNYVPDNRIELRPALDALIAGLPDDGVGNFYRDFVGALEKNKENREEKKMRRDTKVESIVRFHVRRMLKEAVPGKIGTAFEEEPQPGAVGASGRSGVLSPGETVTPEGDPKVKNWRPGLTPPPGWHVIVGQRGKESLAPKAAMPSDVKVTKVPVGYSIRQEQYYQKVKPVVQKTLEKLDKVLGEPGAPQKPSSPEEKAKAESNNLVVVFSDMIDDANKYKEVFLSAAQQNPDVELDKIIETDEFSKEFKEKFGSGFRSVAKPMGAEIRTRMEAHNNASSKILSKDDYIVENYEKFNALVDKLEAFVEATTARSIAIAMNPENPEELSESQANNVKRGLALFLTSMFNFDMNVGKDPETTFWLMSRLLAIPENELEADMMKARQYNRPQIEQARNQWIELLKLVALTPIDEEEGVELGGSVKDVATSLGVSASEVINVGDIGMFKYVFGMISGLAEELDPPPSATSAATTTESFSRAVNSYVNLLSRRGKLNPRDVRVLRENPEFVMDLPGFKEYFKRTLRG